MNKIILICYQVLLSTFKTNILAIASQTHPTNATSRACDNCNLVLQTQRSTTNELSSAYGTAEAKARDPLRGKHLKSWLHLLVVGYNESRKMSNYFYMMSTKQTSNKPRKVQCVFGVCSVLHCTVLACTVQKKNPKKWSFIRVEVETQGNGNIWNQPGFCACFVSKKHKKRRPGRIWFRETKH